MQESPIRWETFANRGEVLLTEKKQPRPHQRDALAAVRAGLAEADRGKLIMACGTGKTFTSLKIAEDLAGTGKSILYLVPSLALMSQTVREWTTDTDTPLRSFAVCSDTQVGKRRQSNDDVAEIDVLDLAFPATTNALRLAQSASQITADKMSVVFATYQSIQVIADAHKNHGLPAFELIICDEAHRTTGATLAGEDESNFVKVHNQDFIEGRKRLYMTATPRVFGDAVKSKASEASAVLCSMDDESLYGKTLFARGFGWAVENGLLTDYKVMVLAVDEQLVSAGVQNRLADGTSELKLDDATKIIGCYKALTKHGLTKELLTDPETMKRAIAFCKDIASSKLVQNEFAAVIAEYLVSEEGKEAEGDARQLECQLEHVDGTFNAKERTRLLDWLKGDHVDNTCRILTNVRCLSEGVDVPALDAILFMHPRKSQIDVVQSVGRVMRRAPGKNLGYVILPIGVPTGVTPEDALNDNERYRIVWQILNALRSHDERFDAMINKADLGVDVSDHIEVIAVSNKLPARKDVGDTRSKVGYGSAADDSEHDQAEIKRAIPVQGTFFFDEFSRAIMAKIVKKCGRRDYWEDWATDIAKIAQTHIARITALVAKPGTSERSPFEAFLAEIRDDLNGSISEAEAIEMLAQHIITRPVFDALFEGYSFTQHNPVSVAMQRILDTLNEHNLEKEAESLQKFYDSVRRRAAGIDNATAKQKIVVELYDKFFRNAFPRMTERLGIVYTPIEIVDFIIHSVNEILLSEFGQTLGSKGVHILDPFTGTGTFITRLLQSGLIKPDELAHKYRNEIHANEIVLLAYYIAAINIESAYHGMTGGEYVPFEGICLTDTFQLYEQERDLISGLMADNSHRLSRQRELDIRVIVGNPPYSVGQSSGNDNAANLSYPKLDERIRETYAERSSATLKNSLYDSYIRAIRWASDRIGDAGVVAYVSNAGWIDGSAADGLRQCLGEEFASIHVFHLRGNQRTSGDRSKREGGKLFGSGSRAPIAISLLVKNPNAVQGRIHFHDIGDYLNREEKLATISRFGSIGGIERANGWRAITPDEHGDWLNQRDSSFDDFINIGDKKTSDKKYIFETYFNGLKTGRDVWCFNSSRLSGAEAAERMLGFYNGEVARYAEAGSPSDVEKFVDADPKKFSWNRMARQKLARKSLLEEDTLVSATSLYRPFFKQALNIYVDITDLTTVVRNAFPTEECKNRAIIIPGNGAAAGFTPLMVDVPPSLQPYHNTQCFPRYLYGEVATEIDTPQGDLLTAGANREGGRQRRDAITNVGLAHFQATYPGEAITKDDLFYYVYGLLHSEDYRASFADNLSKQLPRIPAVKRPADFWAFVAAGRKLALQLPFSEMSALGCGLVCPAPE
jgi:predicted helicase